MKFDNAKPKVGRDNTKLEDLIEMLKLPDGTIKVLVEGTARVHVDGIAERDGALHGRGELVEAGSGRSGGGGVVIHVVPARRRRRAHWPAIDAGTAHCGEEHAV